MSKQNQCDMCRTRCYKCRHYDPNVDEYCQHCEKPIDNTKMFSHFLSTAGRIGRLEYCLNLLIAVALCGIMFWIATAYIIANGIEIESTWQERVYTWIVYGPSILVIILAGTKRAHDAGSPEWLSCAPIAFLVWPNLLLLVFGFLGSLYLIKDPSEPGINEYGTVPNQAYEPQIEAQYNEL